MQVGADDRGFLLELLLTKLRYKQCRGGGSSQVSGSDRRGLQIIGMSATMPNADKVAGWLEAALYQTSFRPIPLDLYVKVGVVKRTRHSLTAGCELERRASVLTGTIDRMITRAWRGQRSTAAACGLDKVLRCSRATRSAVRLTWPSTGSWRRHRPGLSRTLTGWCGSRTSL